MNKKRAVALALTGAALALAAALMLSARRQAQDRVWEEQIFAMDTVMTLSAYGPNGRVAVKEAAQELLRLDALWSVGSPDSEISKLNAREEGLRLSEDTLVLLERAQELCRETGGLFDPTIYPLMTLWGFPSGMPRVPAQEEIEDLLPLVDGSGLLSEDGSLSLRPGQELDPGGIAKGYASARVMEIFEARGVSSGMVSLGGNIQTLGAKPDGSPWRIGIRDPSGGVQSYLSVLSVTNRAVITSGGYERFFEADGERYIHILDPRTGRPARSDLQSATVISEDGILADALSTALYIMGAEDARRFWAQQADRFDMVLLTQSGELLVTEGVADRVQTQRTVRVLRSDG